MAQGGSPSVAVVIPVGPGKEAVLDTLQSVEFFCAEPHVVFIVDDQTKDGTYEALMDAKQPHWHVFRNKSPHGTQRLVHSLCFAFEQVIARTECKLILRLDQDSLIIKPGLFPEALAYMRSNPSVGLFGVYEVDYNRARNFKSHAELFDRETAWFRTLIGRRPCWTKHPRIAESKGHKRGENVFGGPIL